MPQVDAWPQLLMKKVNRRKGAVRAAEGKVGNDLRGRNAGLSCRICSSHPQPSHREDSTPEASQAEHRHTRKHTHGCYQIGQ